MNQFAVRGRPLFAKPIPIASPELPPLDVALERLTAVLRGVDLTNAGEVARLEVEAAKRLETAECVAVSSCTAGLMLVERCLGLCGEVITPSFTFFATAHGLLWNGLKPVLADCDPETLQISAASVERLIGPATAAILGVHLFGCPAPVEELTRLARAARVPLIFDGAHALESRWKGGGVARWGDATVYSLSPTKQLTAGEGGLIATPHRDLAQKLRRARNYGKGEGYDCDLLGLNARMSELQAALCRAGLPALPEAVRRRNRLAEIYEHKLRETPGLRAQRIPPQAFSGRKDFAVLCDPAQGLSRDELAAALRADNIDTRNYFDPPLHRQRLYAPFHQPYREPLTNSENASRNVLCLPIHRGVSERDAELIGARLAELAREQLERFENQLMAGD